ncbi:alanine racemase [Oerskovia sp. Sa1BUA8]|uniref:Alanine racemase n=1 Tax=Oerskovia douganii TaxID=2762210 RepID=A0A9D5UHC4_9CELL|nr:alanine racemase [Oerskovia douganii]MBE7700907.1 alanine racemase [Oerskovia douganii]
MSTDLLRPPRTTRRPPAVSRPTALVDVGALRANTCAVVRATRTPVMAVVKADGYGHGALALARAALAGGASALGVTSIAEAVLLRHAGIDVPVLSWLNSPAADFGDALRARVDVAVPSPGHLRAVVDAARRTGTTATIHLHADIGMSRDGAEEETWGRLCAEAGAAEAAGDVVVRGLMGHLGCADRAGRPTATADLDRFERATRVARSAGLSPTVRHLGGTDAALHDPRARLDMCRVGAGLVGIAPVGVPVGPAATLRPALTLLAPVVGVREAAAGRRVGYGDAHVLARATRLALLPVGYADGIPRITTGRASVLLHGHRCPVVGLVSMDQVVVDVGALPVAAGDVAVVLGPGDDGEPTARDWAGWARTIEHEIVTGIGPRVERHHVEEDH